MSTTNSPDTSASFDETSAPEAVAADLAQSESPPAAADGGRSLNARLALLGISGFLIAISWQVVLPVLPVHLSRIGYSATQVGLLVSFLSLAMGIVELEVGRLTQIFGRRLAVCGGLLAHAAAMVVMATARMAGVVGGALITIGAARAVMWVPLQATVASEATHETRGRVFGMFWFVTSVGFLVGPAIGGFVAAQYGGRAAFYLGAAITLATLPFIIATTAPSRPTLQVTASGAGEVLRHPVIFRVCLANHLHYAITAIWSTFLPLYAVTQGLSILNIGEVFAVQGLTYALVQVPVGRLADRLGPDRLVIPALVGRGLIVLLVPLFHTTSTFLLAGAVYGVAGGFVPITFTMLVARIVSREQYTTAMGVYNSSGDLGFFVGPVLGGAAALVGIVGPFLLCAPLGVAAVATGISVLTALRRMGGEMEHASSS
jgi:MFS family permease